MKDKIERSALVYGYYIKYKKVKNWGKFIINNWESDDLKLLDLSCNKNEVSLIIARDSITKTIRIAFPFEDFLIVFLVKIMIYDFVNRQY